MITIVTAVDITVRAAPEAVYDLVSVPDNWPEIIPSSQWVEGDTHRSVGVGARFTDHILDPIGGTAAALDYVVRRAERAKVLEFEAEKPFGRTYFTYSVTYTFELVAAGTVFRRTARTGYPEQHPLPRQILNGALDEPTHGRLYLENVKRKLEGDPVRSPAGGERMWE
ncbi:SRPBCC family protein [Nocardia vulneris]|uniref:SRPBCC family protein n=1 Tax=Nocardia vulneris TaxID=1141657 RepID=UPI0030CEC46A